jgi:hypothetical protein
MHPASVGQSRVDERHRIIEASADSGGQALGELANVAFTWEPKIGQLEAGTAIDEHLVRAVDQDICHPRLMEQRLQETGAHAVPAQRINSVQYGCVADDETLSSHGCGHVSRRVVAAESGKAIPDEIQCPVVDVRIPGCQRIHDGGHALANAFSSVG